jgi:hypothetical protein
MRFVLLLLVLTGCASQRAERYAGSPHLTAWNAVLPAALREDPDFPLVEERLSVGRLDVLWPLRPPALVDTGPLVAVSSSGP